jgi:hypothetical protein
MRIFLLLPLIVLFSLPVSAQDIGRVREVLVYAYGTPETRDRRALFGRTKVSANETVETVDGGALHLRFNDDTNFHLGSKSTVILDEFVYDPDTSAGKMAIRLSKGTFRFVSGKLNKEGVAIRTPTALIGIRGTDFLVVVEENGTTGVVVEEGEVVITPNIGGGDPVVVVAGSTALVGTSGVVDLGAQFEVEDPIETMEEGQAAANEGGDAGGSH